MRTASLPAAIQQSAPANASLRCGTPASSGPTVRGVKDKLAVTYEKPTTGRVRATTTHAAAAHAAGVHGLADAAASFGGAGVLPDLERFAAVTVIAAAAPTIIAAVKPWLSPIRCKECRGVTTTLCRVCCARGKVCSMSSAAASTSIDASRSHTTRSKIFCCSFLSSYNERWCRHAFSSGRNML